MELLEKDNTAKIIKVFYKVYNILGYGFLEKVYRNAMFLELISEGIQVEKNSQIIVYYENDIVGEYYADLKANNKIVIEIKAAESIVEAHELQLINYLKATELEVGLLLNFGRRAEFKRKLFTNNLKKIKPVKIG